MERYKISRTATGLHIEGFPDAVKVISIVGPLARRIGDLWLHKLDLDFAADCLHEIYKFPPKQWIAREALWRSAVVHYFKCYGDSKARRYRLDPKKIFKGEPAGLTVHCQFEALRNKHIVHDENAFAQGYPGAILNRPEKVPKVERVVCLAGFVQTLDQRNWSNLELLVQRAHKWVATEFDKACARQAEELERETYGALAARPSVTMTVPPRNEVGNTRSRP